MKSELCIFYIKIIRKHRNSVSFLWMLWFFIRCCSIKQKNDVNEQHLTVRLCLLWLRFAYAVEFRFLCFILLELVKIKIFWLGFWLAMDYRLGHDRSSGFWRYGCSENSMAKTNFFLFFGILVKLLEPEHTRLTLANYCVPFQKN